jgi:hypothetical protein
MFIPALIIAVLFLLVAALLARRTGCRLRLEKAMTAERVLSEELIRFFSRLPPGPCDAWHLVRWAWGFRLGLSAALVVAWLQGGAGAFTMMVGWVVVLSILMVRSLHRQLHLNSPSDESY